LVAAPEVKFKSFKQWRPEVDDCRAVFEEMTAHVREEMTVVPSSRR